MVMESKLIFTILAPSTCRLPGNMVIDQNEIAAIIGHDPWIFSVRGGCVLAVFTGVAGGGTVTWAKGLRSSGLRVLKSGNMALWVN